MRYIIISDKGIIFHYQTRVDDRSGKIDENILERITDNVGKISKVKQLQKPKQIAISYVHHR